MTHNTSPAGAASPRKTSRNFGQARISKFLAASAMSLLISAPALLAQTSAVAPRITSRIEDSKRVLLGGNVPLQARTRPDLGEASSSTELTHVRLVLARSPEQQADLDKYLVDLQSKSSPNYHKWLTPEQFGKLYGPSDSDVSAIVAWLESHGLKLEQISTGRTNIAFSGTVAQVEDAFRVKIHSYAGKYGSFFSNTTDPSIPSALAPVVKGVAHLNTIMPTPDNLRMGAGKFDTQTKRLVSSPEFSINGTRTGSGMHPELTSGSGTDTDPYFLYIVAGDAATIYNTPNSLNANFSSGTSYNGKGVTIGIGGVSEISPSTVADYRKVFIGDSYQPVYSPVGTVSINGAQDEAYIDTELSGALAPGAAIIYYPSDDLTSGIDTAINDNKIDIFSLSFGECELDLGTSGNQQLYGYWEQAATQGIAVTVSSGDSGAAACDANTDSNGNNVPDAVLGLQVSGFASTPYNLAIGGTDLSGLNTSFTDYVSTTSDSTTLFRSAEKYIPESAWNDSSVNDTTISANVPITGVDQNGNPLANIVGGGGGKSACSVNTTTNVEGTCTSGYAKPYWQRGVGVPSDSARDLPDISLMAGNGYDPATWLICTDDQGQVSSTLTVTANCTTQSDGNFYFFGFGGTSTSAPAFAGILAIAEQKTGGRLGQAAKELYDLYNSSNSKSVFHDTTTGNNSEPCNSGTPNCSKNSAGYYYLTGYDTTTGYDLATGLGSVDATQLATLYGTANGAQSASIIVTPSATTITEAQTLTVKVAVSGSSAAGTPTGSVTLTSGTYTSSAATLESDGTASISISAGSLTVGTDTLTVTYTGDVNYASATGTATITVTGPIASISPSSLTFASTTVGTSAATQTITVSNTGSAALTVSGVTVTGTDASSFSQTNTCTSVAAAGTCTITVTFTPKASGTLTASISIADNSTNTTTQTVNLTGTGVSLTPSVSLSPTSLTFASTTVGTSAATQAVTLKNTGNANLTVSLVTITGSGLGSFTQTNTCTTVAPAATCTLTVTFTPSTTGSITAALNIADNATGSPQSVALSGTGAAVIPTGSFTLAAPALTVTPGTAGSETVTVTSAGGYAGTVNLTCSITSSPSGAIDAPTCSGGSASVTASGGSGTLTINTTAASAIRSTRIAEPEKRQTAGRWAGVGAIAIAGLFLFGIPARRRSWQSILGVLILIAGIGVLSGCGGSSNKTPTGTTAGTYTVTITGTDSVSTTITNTTTFQLTVN